MGAQPYGFAPFDPGRTFLCRLPHDADLLKWLNQFAREREIRLATLFVIGAVKKATVAFYDQQQRTYRQIGFEENLEILSCLGNVSVREDRPFVHCHATFSNDRGETVGGHLVEGTIVFAAEAHFQEALGTELVREVDPLTGLTLWSRA
ncbi:MAG: DNA-binding protein [Candidatus Hydrogenedentota bacterium]|nr:MAG: DNA-binding protein [Candidatus Hydrogenedentota bacterium]